MLLSIQERLMLGNKILPGKGDFVTLGIVEDFKIGLSITEDEIKEFEIKVAEDGVTWNNGKSKDVEMEVGESVRKIVVDELKRLDDSRDLTPDCMSLYRKFMLPSGC